MRESKSKSSRSDRYYSHRYRSKSRSPSRSSKSKKTKKSKKARRNARRSRSTSDSSTSSNRSFGSHSSQTSRNSRTKSTRGRSSEENSAATAAATASLAVASIKGVDVMDTYVRKTLEVIDEDSFQQKTFYSTRDREAPEKRCATDKVIIDLDSETVKLPKPLESAEAIEEQIFHPNFIGDADIKAEKWLRKLYNYRQRYIHG